MVPEQRAFALLGARSDQEEETRDLTFLTSVRVPHGSAGGQEGQEEEEEEEEEGAGVNGACTRFLAGEGCLGGFCLFRHLSFIHRRISPRTHRTSLSLPCLQPSLPHSRPSDSAKVITPCRVPFF